MRYKEIKESSALSNAFNNVNDEVLKEMDFSSDLRKEESDCRDFCKAR